MSTTSAPAALTARVCAVIAVLILGRMAMVFLPVMNPFGLIAANPFGLLAAIGAVGFGFNLARSQTRTVRLFAVIVQIVNLLAVIVGVGSVTLIAEGGQSRLPRPGLLEVALIVTMLAVPAISTHDGWRAYRHED